MGCFMGCSMALIPTQGRGTPGAEGSCRGGSPWRGSPCRGSPCRDCVAAFPAAFFHIYMPKYFHIYAICINFAF